jgi:transcriptional regulator with XRE-family HTH domain
MTVASPVGDLLRDWRQRRRLSQLDVSLEAAVSARHLSFVETGRSRPSRELLLHLAEHLDVPLRDRNAILLAGRYAPVYRETSLDDDAMAPVRHALDKILAAHSPFPAVIVDRRWNLVSANAPAMALLADGVAPELLEPPVNAIRVSLHPDGSAAEEPAALLFVPLRLSALGTELTFFSTIATFGTALDVTVAELAIESFFPADRATEAALRANL